MPFGIEIDFEKAGKKVGEFLLDFGKNYMKAYTIALANKQMEDAQAALRKKDAGDAAGPERQLARPPPPKVPDKRGVMKKQSSILGRWKPKFFWVKDNYDLAFSEKEGEKEEGVINLWGYKVQSIQFKPEGPRRGGPEWIPDEERPNCVMCNKAFSAIIWHHHCRMCGEVFCGDCADHRVPLNHLGYDGLERVCKKCFIQAGENARRTSVAISPQELKEEAEFHGIQLLHLTRTPYVLQCDTLKDKKEWMEILDVCRKRAALPINPNPVMAAAFEAAHKDLCPTVGWNWVWRVIGSEEEMMSELVQKLIDKQVVTKAFEKADPKIPEKVKRMAALMINKQLKVIINAAVKPAWRGICNQIQDKQGSIEARTKAVLDPVSKARNDLTGKVKDEVVKALAPLMDKFGKTVLDKVVPIAFGPIVEAYENVFSGLNERIREIAKKTTNKETLDLELDLARAQLPGKMGPLAGVHDALDKMTERLNKAKEEVSDVLGELAVGKNVDKVSSSAQSLAHDVLFTISTDAEVVANPNEATVLAAWRRTAPKLLHDATIDLTDFVKGLLREAIMGPVESKFLDSRDFKRIVEPADKLIPDAVKEFISIETIINEIVRGSVEGVLDTAVGSGISDAAKKLASASASV